MLRTYWMAGLAEDAAHFFKFLFILVLYTLVMTLYVRQSELNDHIPTNTVLIRTSSLPLSSRMAPSRRCSLRSPRSIK